MGRNQGDETTEAWCCRVQHLLLRVKLFGRLLASLGGDQDLIATVCAVLGGGGRLAS